MSRTLTTTTRLHADLSKNPTALTRPFKEALLAVIAKRKEEKAAQEAENKAQEVKGAQDWAAWGEKTGMRRRECKLLLRALTCLSPFSLSRD